MKCFSLQIIAKGAANEAFNAGSKAAENIVDDKLKQAETVSIGNLSLCMLSMIIVYFRYKQAFDSGVKTVGDTFDSKIKEANAMADEARDDFEKVNNKV